MVEIVGNAVRTEILRALSLNAMTGRELARTLEVSHTTVHRYLALLEEQGLVVTKTQAGRRQGQQVVWSADAERIAEIGQQWISYAAALDAAVDENDDEA